MAGSLAQVAGVTPRAVVLYVHEDMTDTDFVDPLICALSRVLVAQVHAEKTDMPIDVSLMGSLAELSSEKVLNRLYRRMGPYGDTVMFLLVPYPLLNDGGRVFGTNWGPPHNRGAVSISSLTPTTRGLTPAQVTDTIVGRAYKVLLRYIGHIGGLWGRSGCLLMMPRGLAELDSKSSDFCEEDRAQLVAAGVLKAQPEGDCAPTAPQGARRRLATSARPRIGTVR